MKNGNLLSLINISKRFGGVQALSNINLSVGYGEVHAVVGENGAGKSTLMKIIAGALDPEAGGEIYFEEEPVIFSKPKDSTDLGIAIVLQEPVFFGEQSVLENFYIGGELTNKVGMLDWEKMSIEGTKALTEMNLPPEIIGKPMNSLSIGTQQLVMIARGIHKNAKLLILDEPTSILSSSETNILFEKIFELKKRGVSILYISHRIPEIFKIADKISVLRDGEKVGEFDIGNVNESNLISKMTGREINLDVYNGHRIDYNNPIIEVKNISKAGYYQNISFEIHRGEILCVYGLVGAGRSEVARAIFGELKQDDGAILFNNEVLDFSHPLDAYKVGIVYVPEDRRAQGLFPSHSIRNNLSAGQLKKLTKYLGIIDDKKESNFVKDAIIDLEIKASGSILDPVLSLSGGNQQKVIFGRGLLNNPKLLILDEPTRGIDVGTKALIHNKIMVLAESGMPLLVISSDLPEVLSLADNILVMHEGQICGIVPRSEATEEKILSLALAF